MNDLEKKPLDLKKIVSYLRFWKYIKLPKFLQIDFTKPITLRQQFTVMCTVLTVSCVLFTVVFLIQLIAGGSTATEPVDGKPSEVSTASVPENSAQGSAAPKENSSEEVSKPEESSEAEESGTVSMEELDTMTTEDHYYDEIYRGELILVNKDYSCRSDGENCDSIFETKSSSYAVADATVSLNEGVVEHLNDLFDDFEELYGETDVMIACGYRSYNTQVGLFNDEVESLGSYEEAEQWVAPPGYSEHQTGYVFDLDLITAGRSGIKYDGEGVYSWINENCGDYGFILRYPKDKEAITGYSNEEWHFRYVGQPHSLYIQKHGLVLEEYIDLLHTHTKDNALLLEDLNGERWAAYFVEGDPTQMTSIPLPEHLDYTLSGDNYQGFIVTVHLDGEEN